MSYTLTITCPPSDLCPFAVKATGPGSDAQVICACGAATDEGGSGGVTVWLKIYGPTDPVDSSPPTGSVNTVSDTSTGLWTHAAVPGAQGAGTTGTANSNLVAWIDLGVGGWRQTGQTFCGVLADDVSCCSGSGSGLGGSSG
ncbi:MAG TPA: hypothetical protein VH092_17815, partial [Urbifossiella sp.]|nr:hypothetical protein [Urbifossiella sp.]